MSVFSPVNWASWVPWLAFGYLSWDVLYTVFDSSSRYLIGSVYLAIYLLASFWQGQDEVFHIPQAQAYCSGDFHIWDPKLTTPPGLYALTTVFGNLGGIRSCDAYTLRLFNVLVLVATMSYATDCRALITRAWKQSAKGLLENAEPLFFSISHTAFNIALFPPLFFFSGLFYTDVLSTCAVLRMYRLFLQRKGSLWLYLAGILALTMRQTNIFWVAIFLGGLEVVRTIRTAEVVPLAEPSQLQSWNETALFKLQRYSRGEIHDIPLKDAEIQDFALCAISIAIAVLYHPTLIIRVAWPYLALLISFAGFVFWNGGVVLGDKSNHIATIHLPQLLYLSAFIAIFSFPLLMPSVITFLQPFLSVLVPSLRPVTDTCSKSSSTWKIILKGLLGFGSLIATLTIIHLNTIIHPFTLADNRHYVFYVFRYTILFQPLIKYLLAPVYLLCIDLSYRTLAGASVISTATTQSVQGKARPRRTELQQRSHDSIHDRIHDGKVEKDGDEGPTTSFLLIWALSTALCLIIAPLVEPRYFILPWVFWRLHVPSRSSSPSVGRTKKGARRRGVGELVKGYDYRLWLETFWFLGINAVTGYVFLYRGFEWVQEPGNVQRFMW